MSGEASLSDIMGELQAIQKLRCKAPEKLWLGLYVMYIASKSLEQKSMILSFIVGRSLIV